MHVWKSVLCATGVVTLAACGPVREPEREASAEAAPPSGTAYVVRDTMVPATMDVSAVAEPFAEATLSTKLMGTVTAVLAKEGDRVAAGQPLVRIDARDLDAKRAQVQAGIHSAEAMQREAELMATRMRALYVDSAAAKAQLDAAEAGLSRAQAAVSAARAGNDELDAVAGYAVVRAPFAGVVTRRFVDPGAFAAPGAPLLTVQDPSRLRLVASMSPRDARSLARGVSLPVMVEGVAARAVIEGVIPSAMGALHTVNAIVENRTGALASGGSARLSVGSGTRRAVLVPRRALRVEGDLTGVLVRQGGVVTTRWVQLGGQVGDLAEVLAGLAAGDTILVGDERVARLAERERLPSAPPVPQE